MSGIDADRVELSGWGRTAPTGARRLAIAGEADVAAALGAAGRRGLVARGLGRSYGDAAQNAGGDVADCTPMSGLLGLDVAAGTARVAAGTTLDDLMRWLLPLGFFVPVTPGTRQVTVGGAIACDIHGKNHHADGTFGAHVHSMRLLTPGLGPLALTPDGDASDVFWATAGGMGLTGVVTEATIGLLGVETAFVTVDTERTRDLDETLASMSSGDAGYRYSVAWIDLLATGEHLGRSVLTRGDHAPLDAVPPGRRAKARRFDPRTVATTPAAVPPGLLNPLTVKAFNEVWYRKAPRQRRGELQGIHQFFHPLDAVRDWNRLYGPGGFVQYQFVVPRGAEGVLARVVERLARAGVASFLAVLKGFGPQGLGPLSFPTAGWTLALDVPARAGGLSGLLDELDEHVAAAGGRVYLAKDARLRPESLRTMYPRLDEFRAVRERVDPAHVLQSDLSRRLGL